jgi:hypothetical protein
VPAEGLPTFGSLSRAREALYSLVQGGKKAKQQLLGCEAGALRALADTPSPHQSICCCPADIVEAIILDELDDED